MHIRFFLLNFRIENIAKKPPKTQKKKKHNKTNNNKKPKPQIEQAADTHLQVLISDKEHANIIFIFS